MKTMKRFLSILLTLTLVLGLMPGMSLTAYAEDTILINYPTSSDGITMVGSVTADTVKIHENSESVPGIKFSSSLTFDNALNYITLETTGGFKAGDVITIAGAFNNNDDTKIAKIDIYSASDKDSKIFTTDQFINGRKSADDPYDQTFTLTADAEKLYLGRNGNTYTFITKLIVTRPGTTGHTHDDITFTEWTDELATTQNGEGKTAANSLPSVEGSYYLTADLTISDTWSVPGTTNLCLNGHSIIRTGKGSVISIPSGVTLNLYDEDADAGVITGGNATESGNTKGGGVIINGGTFNMYGGNISGNKAINGGGVYIASGEFVMDGGTISDNDSSNNGSGGGVDISVGSFIFKSGLISGNKATYGGGVRVEYSSTRFTMLGGAIQGNSALGNSYAARGGGIDIMGPFIMEGGKISGNYTEGTGGAMYLQSNIVINGGEIYGNSAAVKSGGIYTYGATISVSGNVRIKDNNIGGTLDGDIYTGGTVNNIDLTGSGKIKLTGSLAKTACIGLSMNTPEVFTSSDEGINAIDYKDNFFSDDSELFIALQDDGNELQLFRQPVSYLDENGEEQQCKVYIPVNKDTLSLSNGWYLVNDSITLNRVQSNTRIPLSASGTVNLILCDGVTLTAANGIRVSGTATLNIYVQSQGASTGKLIATGADGQAGIGSAAVTWSSATPTACGTVNIYGGDIKVTGGKGAAGIGGGARYNSTKQGCPGGTVNICGGTVTAEAGVADDNIGSGVAIGAGGSAENHGTLTVSKGLVAYSSANEITDKTTADVEKVAGNDEAITITRGKYMLVEPGTLHDHDFTYSASNAILTATCTVSGCTLPGNKVDLGIVAPTLTTYGQTGEGVSATASLDGLDAFNTATGKGVAATDIKYYKATKSGSTYTKSGNALSAAPTDAGDYLAEITVSGVKTAEGEDKSATASVGYTIAKATTTITTAPTAGEITYGQTLADSTLTGGAASAAGSFAWKDSTIAPAASDSRTTEYDVVFTPSSGNYTTAECKVKLAVNKADSAVSKAPEANTLIYNGSEQELVTSGSATGGDMQYALGTDDQTAPAEGWSADIPTATNAGTYYVWYKVAGDENHNDTDGEVLSVKILPINRDSLISTVSEARAYYDEIKDISGYDEVASDLYSAMGTAQDAIDNDNLSDEELENAIRAIAEALNKAKTDVKAIDDAAAAGAVKEMIEALPDADKVSLSDKEAIEAAREAYDALSDTQKALVGEDLLKKLTDAEAAFAKLSEESGKSSDPEKTEEEKTEDTNVARDKLVSMLNQKGAQGVISGIYQSPVDTVSTSCTINNGKIVQVGIDLDSLKDGDNYLTMNTGTRLVLPEKYTVSNNFAYEKEFKKTGNFIKYKKDSGYILDLKKIKGKTAYELVLVSENNKKRLIIDVIDLTLNKKFLKYVTLSVSVSANSVSKNAVSEKKIGNEGYADNKGVVTITTSPSLRSGIAGKDMQSARFISGTWIVGNTAVPYGSVVNVTKGKVSVYAKVNSDGSLSIGKAEGSGKGSLPVSYILNGKVTVKNGKSKMKSKVYKTKINVQ